MCPVAYDERVKRPYDEVEYTAELVDEFGKCVHSFIYFLRYVKVIHRDRGRITMVPYDFQKRMVDSFNKHRFTVVLCGRQAGKTSLVAPYALHKAIFNKDQFIGITSDKGSSATDFLRRIKLAYEELPMWLKPGVINYNQQSIDFDNGSRIEATTTTENSFVGRSLNLLICDELSKIRPRVANEFWSSVYPTISSAKTSKIIIISTPKGKYNLFHEIWSKAEAGENEFNPVRVYWYEHPDRDEKWAEQQKRNIGIVRWRQEYECEFLGSTKTVIKTDSLQKLECSIQSPIETIENLRIYEKPKNKITYVCGVDTGLGIGGDYSVIQVLKIINLNPIKFEQVAVYENNSIDPHLFASKVLDIGRYYNNAYLMIENNEMGSTVVSRLWWEFGYDNLFNYGRKKSQLGIRANQSTKRSAILLMKKLIDDECINIKDKKTIKQLIDYQEIKGKFTGVSLNDDLVSGLYWACYILDTDFIDSFKFVPVDESENLGIYLFATDDMDASQAFLEDENNFKINFFD